MSNNNSSDDFDFETWWKKHKVGCISVPIIALLLIVGLVFYVNTVHHTDPGNVGIVISYGTLTAGKPAVRVVPTNQYVNINPFAGQTFTEYPTAQQSLVMVKNSSEGEIAGDDSVVCQDKNGISVNLDVTVLWQVDPTQAETLYLLRPNDPLTGSFNSDVESTVVRPVVRNAITESCSSFQWDSIGASKQQLIANAEQIIVPNLAHDGILVTPSNIFVGEVHYSSSQQQTIDTLTQAQVAAEQAQYLQQKATYEADAAIAKAKGDAQSIQIINEQLAKSPEYIQYLIVKEWDGKLPGYLSTNGSGQMLFVPFQNGKTVNNP